MGEVTGGFCRRQEGVSGKGMMVAAWARRVDASPERFRCRPRFFLTLLSLPAYFALSAHLSIGIYNLFFF